MSKHRETDPIIAQAPPKPAGGRRRAAIREEQQKQVEEIRSRITGQPIPPPDPARVQRLSAKKFFEDVLGDTEMPFATRFKAAKELLPYECPKLQSVTLKGDPGNPLTTVNANTTLEEIEAIAKRALQDI